MHSKPTLLTEQHSPCGAIRAIALDLDGTMLEIDESIQGDLVTALTALSRYGIYCVTATGRPLDFQTTLFAAHGLGTDTGVMCALIADEREIFVHQAGTGYQPHSTWNRSARERWCALHPHAMDLLRDSQAECAARGWVAVPHQPEDVAFSRGLVTLRLETPEQASSICDWINRELEIRRSRLVCNHNRRIVQLHADSVGKGLVLAELAGYLGVPVCSVLAIGDSTNDRSMLDGRLGFRGAAVGNASPSVKAIVRRAGGYLARAPSGLGVIEILRHHRLIAGHLGSSGMAVAAQSSCDDPPC